MISLIQKMHEARTRGSLAHLARHLRRPGGGEVRGEGCSGPEFALVWWLRRRHDKYIGRGLTYRLSQSKLVWHDETDKYTTQK